MTYEQLIARAEKVERQPNGDVYVTLKARSLSGEEFAELIMEDVRRLQSERKESSGGIN